MTYGEVNAPNKSHVLLTTYLHKVTWQTENGMYGEQKLIIIKLHKSCHVITRGQIKNLISTLLQGLCNHTY